jgi:P-type Cu2+ transporter
VSHDAYHHHFPAPADHKAQDNAPEPKQPQDTQAEGDAALGREAMEHAAHGSSVAPETEMDAHAAHSVEERAAMTGSHAHDRAAGSIAPAAMGHDKLDHTDQEAPGTSHAGLDHAAMGHGATGAEQTSHGAHADHTGHEAMFRRRFWVSLLLSMPVLLYSPILQMLLHFSVPNFPGSQWIEPVLSVIVFLYGGVPFLQMAMPELQNRQPGMMTLISLAISVAFIYSLAVLFLLPNQMGFFWELVTLIDIMLLGHWIEMRSVRQASGALNELAKLMPDTADRLQPDGSVETVPVDRLRTADLVLVRPGASVPVDGDVVEGSSEVSEAMITGESKPVEKKPGNKVISGTLNGDGRVPPPNLGPGRMQGSPPGDPNEEKTVHP